jgi:hypothetical protein
MVTSTGNSSSTGGPMLTLPPSEQVASDGTVAVTGANYADSFAQGNPGAMYLSISDGSGLLFGYYPAPGSVPSKSEAPGSGSGTITFVGSYANVDDIINSLTYVATAATGSDDIHYDLWNQAGVETTGVVPISIGSTAAADTWTGTTSSDWNTGANWSTGAPPASGNSVTIPSGTPYNASLSDATLTGETITLNNGPVVDFTNVTLDSRLRGSGTVTSNGSLTVGMQGIIDPGPSGTLTVNTSGTAVTIVNDGTLSTSAGEFLTIDNGGSVIANATTLVNNGVIAVNGGYLNVEDAPPPYNGNIAPETLINSGTVTIGNGGNLELNGTFQGGDVAFDGTGTLSIEQTMAFADGAAVTGFGQGDAINLLGTTRGGSLAFAGSRLDVLGASGNTLEAIPLIGSYSLGNFEMESVGGSANPSTIAYAPDDGPSGVVQPDIIAPSATTVAQGTTLSLGDVSLSNPGTASESLDVDAGSGTLFMNGATGSGTSQLSLGPTTPSQINADLATLTYVPAADISADTVTVTAIPPAPIESERTIPITITSSSGSPTLTEPSSETVTAGATQSVSGSYSDSFAAANPGTMFLGITDTSGTLYARDASGNTVAGSGSNSITLNIDYADANAVLTSLTYTAGPDAGSDSINFDVWSQNGVETKDSVPVTITGSTTTGGGSGPTLSEPSNETVSPNGTVAVSGSYSDSFAAGNPGAMYVGINDSSGTLSATDASGNTVAESGSNSIGLETSYVNVNAILASLHYTAGGSTCSDTINFDLWNQAGVETTATTGVTIDPPTFSATAQMASSSMATNFAAPSLQSAGTVPADATVNASAHSTTLDDFGNQPIGVPLKLGH